MEEAPATVWQKRTNRPSGVYLITIFDFLVAGVIPLLTFVAMVRNSNEEFSLASTMLFIALYVLVMAFAIWAIAGENFARLMLLATVTLVSLSWLFNALYLLLSNDVPDSERHRFFRFLFRAAVVLSLNWWYFKRKPTIAYYKQAERAA